MNSKKTELLTELFDLVRHISSKQQKGGLTMIQLRTVLFVNQKGIVKPTEIAQKFAITPASVTSQIDKLVNEGWLKRKQNQDDKRVLEVVLTQKGVNKLATEVKNLKSNSLWIFNTLDKEEQRELLDLVGRANKNFKA